MWILPLMLLLAGIGLFGVYPYRDIYTNNPSLSRMETGFLNIVDYFPIIHFYDAFIIPF